MFRETKNLKEVDIRDGRDVQAAPVKKYTDEYEKKQIQSIPKRMIETSVQDIQTKKRKQIKKKRESGPQESTPQLFPPSSIVILDTNFCLLDYSLPVRLVLLFPVPGVIEASLNVVAGGELFRGR